MTTPSTTSQRLTQEYHLALSGLELGELIQAIKELTNKPYSQYYRGELQELLNKLNREETNPASLRLSESELHNGLLALRTEGRVKLTAKLEAEYQAQGGQGTRIGR